MSAASRRVWTGDCACPEPRDDVGLAAAVFLGKSHLRIEMAYFLLCAGANKASVVAHICRQSMRAGPALRTANAVSVLRVDRRVASPARRKFQIALV